MADAVKPALTALNLLCWRQTHRNLPCAAVAGHGAVLHAWALPPKGFSAVLVALARQPNMPGCPWVRAPLPCGMSPEGPTSTACAVSPTGPGLKVP